MIWQHFCDSIIWGTWHYFFFQEIQIKGRRVWDILGSLCDKDITTSFKDHEKEFIDFFMKTQWKPKTLYFCDDFKGKWRLLDKGKWLHILLTHSNVMSWIHFCAISGCDDKSVKIYFHLLNRGCEMKSRETANTCSFAAWRAVNPDE